MSTSMGIIGKLRFVVLFPVVSVVLALWLVPEPVVHGDARQESGPALWVAPSLPDRSGIDKAYMMLVSRQKKMKKDTRAGLQEKWYFRGVVLVDGTLWALVEENDRLLRLRQGERLPGGEVLCSISENQLEVMDDGAMLTVALYQ